MFWVTEFTYTEYILKGPYRPRCCHGNQI